MEKVSYAAAASFPPVAAPSDAQALYFILNEEKISINFIRP
jgi:hypothetical protein